MQAGYLIFDIGTGNARVVVAGSDGTIHAVEREDLPYKRDHHYPDSLYFEPEALWQQLKRMAKKAVELSSNVKIKAITSTSQRQGIVLFDENGNHYLGLPNIDNRGKAYEARIADLDTIYQQVGRRPTTLFSALKLTAVKHEQPDLWHRFKAFTSISDWVTYLLSGELVYEHSQATETLLYDVRKNEWSLSLCDTFGIPVDKLPPLVDSGSILGKLKPEYVSEWNLGKDVAVIVGGADTQLAIKGTNPLINDYVIVSGTTTPVTKVMDEYRFDCEQRTWTNGHVEKGQWIFETNCGVTGLNYQRLKAIFYPNEDYSVIEKEINELEDFSCIATLGSILSDEQEPLKTGGFVFETPVSHELKRAHFALASLGDIACSIAENYRVLHDVTGDEPEYIWGCGGGFQSKTLRQLLANLLQKEIRIRKGYRQSSVSGAILICNEILGIEAAIANDFEVTNLNEDDRIAKWFEKWKWARKTLRNCKQDITQKRIKGR
ncbi:sugar kinase [Paenactinomyces guangxiensis]|nr:FGGY family carbohydrate kinase [Paenactinomyces guangxiensis]MBH8590610.1 sugar kinase [Paenactinomyces guangxiensis]